MEEYYIHGLENSILYSCQFSLYWSIAYSAIKILAYVKLDKPILKFMWKSKGPIQTQRTRWDASLPDYQDLV